jgi:hypothetical protein
MKTRYLKFPDAHNPSSYSWYPLLQVCMRYRRKSRVFHALVDSGAIDCIFPESLGRLLGVDVPSGTPKTYYAIAKQAASGFMHTVDLQVTGLDQWISLEVGFVSANISPLLGQNGFFEKYQIIFERFRHQFEVNTRENALMRGRKGR